MKLRLFKRKAKQIEQERLDNALADASVAMVGRSASAYLEAHPPKTGIVKAKPKQFIMDEPRKGGRIVKTMPANLRHMKELADKTDD